MSFSRLDKTKERISELEHTSIEMSQTEMEKKKKKKQNRISMNCGAITSGVTEPNRNTRRIKKEGAEGILEVTAEDLKT